MAYKWRKAMFKPLSKTRLFESIVNMIREQIQSGQLKPGDKLPSERELAELLDVSRNSLREALRTLEMMNYLEIRPGEGVFVKETNINDLIDPIVDAISVDNELLLDLLDVREIIEVETARLAALNGTEDDFEKIKNVIEKAEKKIADKSIGLDEDHGFHLAIAEATHNQAFLMIFILISEALMKNMEATLTIPGQPEKTIADHKAVCKAICSRQPEKAAHLMKDHIIKARKNLENSKNKQLKNG
ncbi:MAG: FadR family transcriptional regulator [Tindallia sp. MSAO_Bac2]|nr:MAG: FadR family transcriptional regulator [Tindallia sp. MSAO_Bac2]